MELTTDQHAALAAIPGKYATPDPATLATIPRGGVALSYMGHADVTLALLDIDPLWTWRPAALADDGSPLVLVRGKRLVLWGYLTIHGVERMCVGTCDDNKGDPEKELIGDLLRNGAMRFGVATRLWSKAEGADPAGSEHGGGYDAAASRPRAARPPAASPPMVTEAQIKKMAAAFGEIGIKAREERLEFIARHARQVDSSTELTRDEAGKVIDAIERVAAARRTGT